jgi:Na+/H+ antiporter NhaD/arsenite permease-like protein
MSPGDRKAGIPAASEVNQRESQKSLRRAQRRNRLRFWRVMRSYRITCAMLVLGSAGIAVVATRLEPVCVVGGSHDGACLGPASYWTLWLLLAALLLMTNESPPDIVLLGVTTLLLLTNVISNDEAWRGISSPSLLVIGVLFVVARALEETRAVEMLLLPMLGSPTSTRMGVLRLCIPVAFASAFLNNTPIVAMLLSVCESWAARNGLSIHALLMPLSFASMLGGMCTLIGTSTNLVLNAQIENDPEVNSIY